MNYEKLEVKLKTNKSKEYLWNKMNTPEKIIRIEDLSSEIKITKLSNYNYELKSEKEHILVTFIPNKGVNMNIIFKDYSLLAWFEIEGDDDCLLIHGAYRPTKRPGYQHLTKDELIKESNELKEHFLEELKFIAE